MKEKRQKYKIYLFRHGQTYYNKKGIFTGWKDSKLTKEGIKHAKTIGEKLKNKKIQVAIHTRLSRSKDTLKYVIKHHPECKTLLQDDRMIERSYGSLSGKTHDSIIKKFGKEQYDKWHRGYDKENRPPKGESFADVEKRVKKFIKFLKKYMRKNKVNVMISAHGNSIRLFRKIIERAPKSEVVKWFIPYDKVYVYEV
jgi:2,3-bisphosphoglycerate-dependent phosphoglycerate mutase